MTLYTVHLPSFYSFWPRTHSYTPCPLALHPFDYFQPGMARSIYFSSIYLSPRQNFNNFYSSPSFLFRNDIRANQPKCVEATFPKFNPPDVPYDAENSICTLFRDLRNFVSCNSLKFFGLDHSFALSYDLEQNWSKKKSLTEY